MSGKQSKTVEFSNLSEDHKAEFLHFLIKNNICFQEGKENCTAKIAIKGSQDRKSNPVEKNNRLPLGKVVPSNQTAKPGRTNEKRNNVAVQRSGRPLKELTIKNQTQNYQLMVEEKELKTPTKVTGEVLRTSSLSCKSGSQTLQKNKKITPKSVKPNGKATDHNNTMVSDYDARTKSTFKAQHLRQKVDLSKEREHSTTHQKDKSQGRSKVVRKSELLGRKRPANKYHKLFESVEKGRAVRWPLSMLERTVEQIYDDIFTKNTQCLQTRNIENALKTLNLNTFAQLIQSYFFKKFKGRKLASSNLNNLLYSLSYHVSKSPPPIFLKTFEDFLLNHLQYEDTLYYLFARNVMKKELKTAEKNRDLSRAEGTYFPEAIKSKDIAKMLKGIIGRDSELLQQYKGIVSEYLVGDQMEVYSFLKVLLDDFHERRVFNAEEYSQTVDHPLFEKEANYDQRNEELTFGEEHYDQSEAERKLAFWECLSYSRLGDDSLLELIMEKMGKKSMEFLQILGGDLGKGQLQLQRLHKMLLVKAESLSLAVFEMNKMKWLKELSISDPTEEDIATVEKVQMQLRKLRESPTARDIGEFCKSILTVQQLVNQLQFALTACD